MKPAIAVCYGGGVDSSAMLIEMHRRGERPSLITMADVGGEKQETYDFLPIFANWLRDHDFPELTMCIYKPKEDTQARYRQATMDVVDKLGLTLDETRLNRLSMLYGNMVANDTLPGIAFGLHSCALKWKLEAQEPT